MDELEARYQELADLADIIIANQDRPPFEMARAISDAGWSRAHALRTRSLVQDL